MLTVFDTIGQNFSNFSVIQNLKKNLEEKKNEKSKIYTYIGMEVYDFYRQNKFRMDELNVYFDKLIELDKEIDNAESELEQLNSTSKSIKCSCGNVISDGMKFCAKCGRPIEVDEFPCKCGRMLKKGMKFCTECGQNVNELMEEQMRLKENKSKEMGVKIEKCICGAQIVSGQPICMTCGRRVSIF